VSLYVTHYNMCRVHEALRTTPAVALGLSDRVWTIGDLLDAALAVAPADPTTTAPDRRRRFRVIEGGRTQTAPRKLPIKVIGLVTYTPPVPPSLAPSPDRAPVGAHCMPAKESPARAGLVPSEQGLWG
jgi:hypothetical protein